MKKIYSYCRKRFIILPISLLCALGAKAEIKVSLGSIENCRSTKKNHSRLEIQFLLTGQELAQIYKMKVDVAKAVDDKLTNILRDKEELWLFERFYDLKTPYDKNENEGVYESLQTFVNPKRDANSVSLLGTVQLLNPSADPASTITFVPSEILNKPIDHPALKAAKIKLVFTSVKSKDVYYTLIDPQNKLAMMELCDEAGNTLPYAGSSQTIPDDGTPTIYSLRADEKTAKFKVKIHLATAKSLTVVPFRFERVKLP